MDKQKKNMGAVAFLPLIVFLVCYVGCGITFTLLGVDEPFGKFPRDRSDLPDGWWIPGSSSGNGRKRFGCESLSAFYSGETFGSGCIFDVLFYFYINRDIHGNDCSDGSNCY